MRTYAPADTAIRPGRPPRGAIAGARRRPPRRPAGRGRPTSPTSRTGWTRGSWPASAGRGIEPAVHPPGRGDRGGARRPDVVVVTPTASGKSLCYALPILQAIAEDPAARALLLFPTKALGQDQVAEFGELAAAAELHVAASTYDGDTPAPIRSAIRAAGQVVVTNPDMLHAAILPHHTKWFQLFEQLRFIVIDELHTYRGVFGSHVANVLRRLLRICAHYGSKPVIVCCSATIGNPAELAATLTGAPGTPHRPERGARRRAPRPPRRPAGHRPASGARGSAVTLAQRWALPFLRAGRQTIVFGRSRVAVEILLTGPARVAARELRAAVARPRLPRRLPADRAARDRARPARRRDPRRRRHQRARARRRHRPPRRLDPGRLPGLDRGDVAADRSRRAAPGDERRRPRRVGARRSTSTSSTTRSSCSTARPRRRASTRTTSTSCSPTCARRRSSCRSNRARSSGRGRPTTCSRSSPRRATSARPTTGAGTGERELPGVRDLAADRGAGERRDHRHDARPAAGPRRGRPVLGPGPRPRARDLHPRVGPVPRRPARLGRAQGLRPPSRRRPLHVRQPRGDAQAARCLRRGAGDRAAGGSTAR